MSRSRLSYLDRYLYHMFRHHRRTRWANGPMVLVTQSGTKGTIWLIVACFLFLVGNGHARTAAVESVCALLAAEGAINLVLKPAIARERPYSAGGPGRIPRLLVRAPGAHSWPSAHAGSAIAAAIPLAVAYPVLGVVFLAFAALIAYSRVYVGVHYPFDVLAGLAVGILCAIGVLIIAAMLIRVGWWPESILSALLTA
jgi:undecaprenyl-diphosphatase